jgi:hypothetical protein
MRGVLENTERKTDVRLGHNLTLFHIKRDILRALKNSSERGAWWNRSNGAFTELTITSRSVRYYTRDSPTVYPLPELWTQMALSSDMKTAFDKKS